MALAGMGLTGFNPNLQGRMSGGNMGGGMGTPPFPRPLGAPGGRLPFNPAMPPPSPTFNSPGINPIATRPNLMQRMRDFGNSKFGQLLQAGGNLANQQLQNQQAQNLSQFQQQFNQPPQDQSQGLPPWMQLGVPSTQRRTDMSQFLGGGY